MIDRDPTKQNTETRGENSSELELKVRRTLAVQALDSVSEVLERPVTPKQLLDIIDDKTLSSGVRLIAKRAIRCIVSISENSTLVDTVGTDGVYHYTEAVMLYAASDKNFLELMEKQDLTAEEATGLYALRELIAENANEQRPSFQQIFEALKGISMSVYDAAHDPDSAVEAFDAAGYFTDHFSRKQLNGPIFYPPYAESTHHIVEDDTDGSVSKGITDGIRESLQRPPEEQEGEAWQKEAAVEDFLKNLIS